MIKIKIPSSFELFGHRYKIVRDNKIFNRECLYGECDHDSKIIRLQPPKWIRKSQEYKSISGKMGKRFIKFKLTDDDYVETFLHEVTHAILGKMGSSMDRREEFVSTFSSLLYQVLKTSRYSGKNKDIYRYGKPSKIISKRK